MEQIELSKVKKYEKLLEIIFNLQTDLLVHSKRS